MAMITVGSLGRGRQMQQIQSVKLKQDYMLAASIEDEAVLQLLRLGEHQPPQDHYMPLQERLTPNAPRSKPTSNSSLHAQPPLKQLPTPPHTTTTQRWKGKSQTEPSSLEHSAANSHNKENLKKLLEKLERSPSPTRKPKPKPSEPTHLKTEKAEPLQRRRREPLQTPGPNRRSLERLFLKDKNRDFIKNLVKAKIVEKLRSIEMRKAEAKGQKGRISTLRDLHGTTMRKALKPSYGLLADEERMNVGLLSGKNSRIHLNQLLF